MFDKEVIKNVVPGADTEIKPVFITSVGRYYDNIRLLKKKSQIRTILMLDISERDN